MTHIKKVGFKFDRLSRIEWENRMESAWRKVPPEKRLARKCVIHKIFMRPKVSKKGTPFFGCPKWPECGEVSWVNSLRPIPAMKNGGRVRFVTGKQR